MSVPSIETKIFEAIKSRVAVLPMASTYEIVWTDGTPTTLAGGTQTYTPDPTKRYLQCTWSGNDTQRPYIGSDDEHRYPGVLTINVCGTIVQGSGVAREVAGQVALHFPADHRIPFMDVCPRVIKRGTPRGPFIGTHVVYSVQIEIEDYA